MVPAAAPLSGAELSHPEPAPMAAIFLQAEASGVMPDFNSTAASSLFNRLLPHLDRKWTANSLLLGVQAAHSFQ